MDDTYLGSNLERYSYQSPLTYYFLANSSTLKKKKMKKPNQFEDKLTDQHDQTNSPSSSPKIYENIENNLV